MTTNTPGFDGWLPGISRHPAYWSTSGGEFDAPPDLLVIHSAATGDNPAAYLVDPRADQKDPVLVALKAAGQRHGPHNEYLCKDGIWRVQSCAHICATSRDGDWWHLASLLVPVWGAGGSICQGKGRVNYRALHIELPAHAGPGLADALVALVHEIRLVVPSQVSWTCHRWIAPDRKKDPVCWSDDQVREVMLGTGLGEVR